MLQTQVNKAVDATVAALNGKRVAMPNGAYMGECTAPVTRYLVNLGCPWNLAMYGDRADGWGVSFPSPLAPYFTHEAFKPGKKYPKGSIIMWNSPHIAVATANTDGSSHAQVFEQNADPDGSPCKTFNRELSNGYRTATYVLIPKVDVPKPAAPVPAAVYYTVKSGDNLSKIARDKKTTLAALMKLNPTSKLHSHNYDLIYPGEKLRVK